jgi:carbonic anhydrase
MIKNHPLLPRNIKAHGLIMNSETGKIEIIINGDN